ncbi:YhgE/Pip domain-containing protein [Cellulomonas rhizosphaerae]|uniref:YhgE/Pip domain-containing protein n=1 Tax=Cellulomonas rhizosphaerae TaxID=2293719 RepID=A0A413RHD6_9CELL|nr:YhgE/Pip domain-containing protein [Cellulomonas rhizosphaerae]RHA37530.1 YhgE/Pip domain-containing protein [Cellulomonas rhizosphaerae]
MNVLALTVAELRRYRRPLERLAIGFLVLVPTLYGGLYLWSNWDPYGKVDTIKVAVVNDDVPVTTDDGEKVTAGDQMVDELEKEPVVDWTPTDAAEAADGLAAGRYLMVITIPSDFSANLASVEGGSPQAARVVLARDGANGFIVSVASRGAALELQERINQAALAAYLRVAFGDLGELKSGLKDAAKGASDLADGAAAAHDGATKLSSGLKTAVTGTTKLRDGAEKVADGNEQIAAVVDPVTDDLLPLLPGAVDAAGDVTAAVSDLTDAVATGASSIGAQTTATVAALDALAAAHPELADDRTFTTAHDAAEAAAARADDVTAATKDVAAAAKDAQSAADAIGAKAPAIEKKISGARDDIDALATGSRQVADGLADLVPALSDAQDGAAQLADGTQKLDDGATKLADSLTGAAGKVPHIDDPEATADAISSPSLVEEKGVNLAPTYGAGLAPFFFGIALCVFGVVAFTVLRPINPRGLTSRASSVTVALAGFLPVAVVGIVGGWVLTAVIVLTLGLDPVSWPGLLGLVTLGSLAFTAIAHALRTAWGVVGSSIALVLLMLQLTSCAGISPVQTLPGFFQALHPVLPMTYVVDGLRIAMTGGPSDRLGLDLLVVAGFLAVAVAAGVLVVRWRRRWHVEELKPVLGE